MNQHSTKFNIVQGDHSACDKPPVDCKTKVLFWPGLAWLSQAKAELLFGNQREVRHKLNGHPVQSDQFAELGHPDRI